MDSKFTHFDLKLIEPSFGSELTDLIIDLDHLRKKRLEGSTPPSIFFQLKEIFHTLESIGSARIEGNNTTIAEYMETKIEDGTQENFDEDIREILNVEKAMSFIDDNIKDYPINRAFISELHKMVVDGLTIEKEGDKNPGQYRTFPVKINKSTFIPPEPFTVESYMDELIHFINNPDSPKYDLLKVAIAHHRFVWIHPFGNGNGRTVRLFTYAMLVKQGFKVDAGRILNPTAVFCSNRDNYYHYLTKADTGKEGGILEWCQYVLKGLKEEIEKIDRLSDYENLKKEILYPMLDYSIDRKFITDIEAKVLKKAIDKKIIQNSDLKEIFPGKLTAEISRNIKRLTDKKMLAPERDGTRKYIIYFNNNYLLRGIIYSLGEKGFLPMKE